MENTHGGVLLLVKSATLLKVTHPHWCFSSFLNYTNDTKSRNASYIKKFWFPFILFITFNAIGSLDIVSFNIFSRYVSSEWCFVFTCFYLVFSWQTLFSLCLLAKRINLLLSSLKCILSLLLTNQLQIFSKSLLSSFSILSTSLCWYKIICM